MTFSLLAIDPGTGELGGAAATGSLCVGGWVLRGTVRAGLSASQGAAPSTFWGEDVLARMQAGEDAADAVKAVTIADAGRAQRQLSALGLSGQGAVYTGAENGPEVAGRIFENGVAAGNLLSSVHVVEEMCAAFLDAAGPLGARLLAALEAADRAGGDARGLQSAALLILSPDCAPQSLRIDYSEAPLADLRALYGRATSGDYDVWRRQVPSHSEPQRILRDSSIGTVRDGTDSPDPAT